jgi:MFS superfamily sulfate permease-like transporter
MTTASLNDALIAIVTTVGIAAAITIAVALAGAFFQRTATRSGQAVRAAVPAQHVTQTDDARELVLR